MLIKPETQERRRQRLPCAMFPAAKYQYPRYPTQDPCPHRKPRDVARKSPDYRKPQTVLENSDQFPGHGEGPRLFPSGKIGPASAGRGNQSSTSFARGQILSAAHGTSLCKRASERLQSPRADASAAAPGSVRACQRCRDTFVHCGA